MAFFRTFYTRGGRGLWLHGDGGNFDFCSADEASDLNGGAGGLGVGHEFFVDLVHLGDVVEVGDVNGDGDEVGHLETGLFDDFFDGGDGVGGLQGDVRSGDFALRVGALLAGNVEGVAGDKAFAEGHALFKPDGLVLGEGRQGEGEQEYAGGEQMREGA